MKKVLVVGASSGMGRELAIKFAKNDFLVGITARRKSHLEDLQSQYPNVICLRSFDCRKMNNTFELEQVIKEMKGLDLLVLCAGHGEINKSLDFKLEKDTNTLNVQAFTEISGWAFNYFVQQGGGHLVVITSIAGLRGGRVAPAYNASKAYQVSYLEGLRQRAIRQKLPVHITDIRPGFVDTAMAKGGGQFWVVPVEKASRQIFKHIRKKTEIVYISKRWRLIAWLFKLLPATVYKRL